MIHIARNSVNSIITTCKEKMSNASNRLLFVFESDQTKKEAITIPPVVMNDRHEEVAITENDAAGTVTINGTVTIKPAGFWSYKVYEQTSSTNTNVNDESVIGLVEQGKMHVSDTSETNYIKHTTTDTNFIHIP